MSRRPLALIAVATTLVSVIALVAIALAGSDIYAHLLGLALIPVSILAWLARLTERRHYWELLPGDRYAIQKRRCVPGAEPVRRDGRRRAGFAGRWAGTACIRPTGGQGVMRVYPLSLTLADSPLRADLISRSAVNAGDGVVAVEVLEHDSPNARLDLRVVVAEGGQREEYVAHLTRRAGMLVSEDETGVFALDLKPANRRRRRRSLAARRAVRRRPRLAAAAQSLR